MLNLSEVLDLIDRLLAGNLSSLAEHIGAIQQKTPYAYRHFVFALIATSITMGEDCAKMICVPLVVILCPQLLDEKGMLSHEAVIAIDSWLKARTKGQGE